MIQPKRQAATVALLLATALSAQQPAAALAEADLKKLSELLAVMIPPRERDGKDYKPDAKKEEAAAAAFEKEVERLKKSLGDKLVSDFAGWSEISHRVRTLNGVKSPSGFGTPQETKVALDVASVRLEFTYALVLPVGYDPKKRYPLVVCLHDEADGEKDYTGSKYLSEVLLKAPKELKDQFVFMAPNLGPKAGGKDVRIEFGDDNQFLNVYAPLRQVLERHSIDVDRLYVEGTGRGGELAANLVAYKPFQWAAAAIRTAMPRKPALMSNAFDVPCVYHYRQGSKAANAKTALQELETQKAAGQPIVLTTYDPLPPNLDQRARAGMLTDPVHDATGPILTFFADKKRRPPPKAFTFATDKAMFKTAQWVRIVTADFEPEPARVTVKTDAATNTVDVTVEHIESFRVLLSDAVVDLDKPVKVVVNGTTLHDGKLDRAFDAFFNNWRPNRVDPGYTPCAQVNIDVPPPKAEDKKEGAAPKEAEAGKTGG